jgi:hypothetical protein
VKTVSDFPIYRAGEFDQLFLAGFQFYRCRRRVSRI